MILKEIIHHIKNLKNLLERKDVYNERDELERTNVCGGVLTVNKTHVEKVKEARNG